MSKRFRIKKIVPTVVLYCLIFSLVILLSSADNFYVFSKPYDQIAPRSPQDLSLKIGTQSVELFWEENSEADLFNYMLYIRTGEEKESKDPILLGKTNYHKIEELNENTTYYISLVARDKNKNESKPTPEIGFTPDGPLNQDFKVAAWIQASADLEKARDSFTNHAEIFSTLSPFWYSAQEDGNIEKRGDILNEDVRNTAREKGVKMIPSITNNFDKDSKLSNLLKNEQTVASHIDIIMNEVLVNGYDGIDIDYENLDPAVKKQFTDFIIKLAEKLHEKGKIISVTVQAKQSDAQAWSGAGALDFKKLGEVADQFRVMTYDFSRVNTDPGSIAPVYWIKEVIEYAKSKVPKDKIMVGVPFYGYQWCTSDNDNEQCKNKGLTWEGVQNVIAKYDPVIEWNEASKTPWFLYVDEDNNTKVVNYEDHKSLEAKLEAVKELDVAGIAIWRLGSEDPQSFETIKEKLGKKIRPPRHIEVAPQNQAIKVKWDKSNNPSIKGYRVFIRQKAQSEDQATTTTKTTTSDDTTSQSTSTSYWQENYTDIFDANELTMTDLKNNQPHYVSVMPLTWGITAQEATLSSQEKQSRSSRPVIATPIDLYYPGQITDLEITDTGTTTIDLQWTAPGDEQLQGQATKYEIRYANEEITEETFTEAILCENLPEPSESETTQQYQVGDLEPGGKYYFAIKTFDEVNNTSDISNLVTTETIDNIPPAIPSAPDITSLNGELFIKWESSPDKDIAGYKIFYRQEKSYYQVIEVNKEDANYSLKNLENNYDYYVSLVAFDIHDNESARGPDAIGQPKDQANINRVKGVTAKSGEKLKATLATFSKKLFNEKAIPFIVVISVIVINFFIYQGLKREIQKPRKKRAAQTTTNSNKLNKVIDLKNIRRTLK